MSGWLAKMSRKPPAFQCYAANLIADKNYRLMGLAERGLWVSMYLECWVNEGVPLSPDDLAKFLGFSTNDVESSMSQHVMSFFVEKEFSIVSPELDDYRLSLQKVRKKQSEGGKIAQENKRKKSSDSLRGQHASRHETLHSTHDASSLDQIRLNQVSSDQSIKEWVSDYDNAPLTGDYQKLSKGF